MNIGWIISGIIGLCGFSVSATATTPTRLTTIQTDATENLSRFTFTLSNNTPGRMKYDPKTAKLTLLFTHTDQQLKQKNIYFTRANIKRMQVEYHAPDGLTIIITPNRSIKPSIKVIENPITHSTQVVLDIVSQKKYATHTLAWHEKRLPKAPTHPVKQAQIDDLLSLLSSLKVAPQPKLPTSTISPQTRPLIVAIDAGHGGKDTGAIGPNGIREKNVVLAIARILAKKINTDPYMRAVLTRSGDYFVPLRQRLVLARKNEADLFIAIHADAYFHNRAKGVSVYALSGRGATSEAARWLAKKENYSELDGVELDSLRDRSPQLRSVLIDMAQTATIDDSLKLGNKVLTSLHRIATLHYPRVEQAQFVVLKSPDIPSILVETGFITNSTEEKRLANTAYQEKVAQAIFSGIKIYHTIIRE